VVIASIREVCWFRPLVTMLKVSLPEPSPFYPLYDISGSLTLASLALQMRDFVLIVTFLSSTASISFVLVLLLWIAQYNC
jgi:hypothetical protein